MILILVHNNHPKIIQLKNNFEQILLELFYLFIFLLVKFKMIPDKIAVLIIEDPP